MAEFHLALTAEERDYLAGLLRTTLGETRAEVHHTHTPAFRDKVIHEEDVIRGLLEKLKAKS